MFSNEAETLRIANRGFIIYAAIALVKILVVNKGKMGLTPLKYCMPIVVFSIIDLPIALSKQLAIEKTTTLILLTGMTLLIYNTVDTREKLNCILYGLVAGGFLIALKVVAEYGFSGILVGFMSDRRIGADILQLNLLGRYTYMSAAISFYYIYYKKLRLFWIPLLFTTCVCLGSGSRQAQMPLIIAIVFLYILRDSHKEKAKRILHIIIAGALIVFALQLPIFSAFWNRLESGLFSLFNSSQSSISDQKRIYMIRLGLQTFLHNPIFGIGLGNTGLVTTGIVSDYTYLHNNYVELLAGGGITGFLCYYYIYGFLYKRVKHAISICGINSETIMIIIMLICQLVADMFTANYNSKIQYILFVYAIIASEKTIAERQERERQENYELNK